MTSLSRKVCDKPRFEILSSPERCDVLVRYAEMEMWEDEPIQGWMKLRAADKKLIDSAPPNVFRPAEMGFWEAAVLLLAHEKGTLPPPPPPS